MKGLSIRQKQLYDFIDSFAKEKGYAPSVNEMGEGICAGRSTVVAHILALRRKKYVLWQDGQPRTIHVIPHNFPFGGK